jgi:hypothetical protein
MASVAKTHYNNAFCKSVAQVVDTGWANKSVQLPNSFGRVAVVTIMPNEISELYSAVFNDDHTAEATLQPGNFVFIQARSDMLVIEATSVDQAWELFYRFEEADKS